MALDDTDQPEQNDAYSQAVARAGFQAPQPMPGVILPQTAGLPPPSRRQPQPPPGLLGLPPAGPGRLQPPVPQQRPQQPLGALPFTQADNLTLQRLQMGLSEAQNHMDDGTLTPQEGQRLKAQILQRMRPLLLRQQQTKQQAEAEGVRTMLHQQAIQEAITQQGAQYRAAGLQRRVAVYTDPLTGRMAHFLESKPGSWEEIEFAGEPEQAADMQGAKDPGADTGKASGEGEVVTDAQGRRWVTVSGRAIPVQQDQPAPQQQPVQQPSRQSMIPDVETTRGVTEFARQQTEPMQSPPVEVPADIPDVETSRGVTETARQQAEVPETPAAPAPAEAPAAAAPRPWRGRDVAFYEGGQFAGMGSNEPAIARRQALVQQMSQQAQLGPSQQELAELYRRAEAAIPRGPRTPEAMAARRQQVQGLVNTMMSRGLAMRQMQLQQQEISQRAQLAREATAQQQRTLAEIRTESAREREQLRVERERHALQQRRDTFIASNWQRLRQDLARQVQNDLRPPRPERLRPNEDASRYRPEWMSTPEGIDEETNRILRVQMRAAGIELPGDRQGAAAPTAEEQRRALAQLMNTLSAGQPTNTPPAATPPALTPAERRLTQQQRLNLMSQPLPGF